MQCWGRGQKQGNRTKGNKEGRIRRVEREEEEQGKEGGGEGRRGEEGVEGGGGKRSWEGEGESSRVSIPRHVPSDITTAFCMCHGI